MTTTIRSIINLALKDSGIVGQGQTAAAEDINDALTRLQWMMDEWTSNRWFIFELQQLSKVSTGAAAYSIGPGQDFDIAQRPAKIEYAFLRQLNNSGPNPVDSPLTVLSAREDYDSISVKSLVAFPTYIYLQTSWPIGFVKTWGVCPASLYEIFIDVLLQLNTGISLDADPRFPPVYFAALHYNLALRLRPGYQMQPDPTIVQLARSSLNSVKMAAAQIALLRMPTALLRDGIYNFMSDQFY